MKHRGGSRTDAGSTTESLPACSRSCGPTGHQAFYHHRARHDPAQVLVLRSSGLLAALIVVTAFPRIAYDLHINGTPSHKASRIAEISNALAAPYFKPSTNLRAELNVKSKGVTIAQMMKPPYNWAELSAVTAFGAYNYTMFRVPRLHYNFIFGAYALFLVYLAIAVAIRGNLGDRTILLGGFMFSFLIIGLAINFAWTSDFQAQGRYLFGIFAILAVILARSTRLLRPVVVNLFLLSCFVWSVYSFWSAGLAQVPHFKDVVEVNPNFRRP